MEKKKLVLTGTAGYSEGETFSIPVGESAVIGRSRSCDFSLRKLKSWLEAENEERDEAEEFKTVSRRHVKIEVRKEGENVIVGITDLSRNGTFIDEEKISTRFEIEDWEEPHYVRLGEHEQYRMEIGDADGEDEADEEKQIRDADEDGEAPEEETGRKEKEPEAGEDEDEEEKEEEHGEDEDEDEEDEDEGEYDDDEDDEDDEDEDEDEE